MKSVFMNRLEKSVSARKSNLTVPPNWSTQEKRFADGIKENLDVMLGHRGDPLQRAVTFQDLLDANIIELNGGVRLFGSIDDIVPAVNDIPNLAIPPAPTSLQASGAFQNIILTWNLSLYRGHSFVEVFRHTSDSISDATMVAQVSGFTGVYADPVGSNQTFYYWVRAVNVNGVLGPFNSGTGTQGQTAPDVSFLLTTLSNAVTTSELATSLSTPIAKIDPLATFTGYSSSYSGNSLLTRMGAVETTANGAATSAQLSSEATARASADSAIATNLTTLTTSVGDNTTSISNQATTIDGLSAKYVVKIDNNGAVAGYGLASTANAAGNIVSEFIVNADRFAIMRGGSNTAAASVPFVVQASSTTLGGETVPAGVYIDAAFIKNGSIQSAKIADAAIDNAKIANLDAGKINAGTISTSRLNIDGSTLTSVNGVLQLANLAVTNAKIANLAVNNAKIGNLAVSTLKIQDQAVTFPNAITTSANLSVASSSSNTTFATIQTLTGTYSGAPVLISGSFAVRSHDDQALMRFRLRRGSTVLFTSSSKAVRQTPDLFIIPFNFLDTSTSSGSRTYTLQAYVQDQFGNYSDRTISTLEVKK